MFIYCSLLVKSCVLGIYTYCVHEFFGFHKPSWFHVPSFVIKFFNKIYLFFMLLNSFLPVAIMQKKVLLLSKRKAQLSRV